MARASDDVSRIVCANTLSENEKRLLEARINHQGRNQAKQDLIKLFTKLNQTKASVFKALEQSSPSCYNRRVTSGSYGPVPEFPPGSWWGIRMDCSRNRVHEPFDADVHEGPFGVISVCTSSSNVNEDVDLGDFLTLTGQVYREQRPNVDPFICNYKNQIPLRLIRSYNLQNDIAPNTGYRYDGLYTVIDCWIGATAQSIKYNKFALMRLANQTSPNWSGKTTASLSAAQRCVPLAARSVCPSTYALRKCCSHNRNAKRKFSSDRDDSESLPPVDKLRTLSLIDRTSRKSVPESSIVMRHVFKKPLNNADNAISASVPDRKTLTCLGASATKTHSTNISIRMGLYESSHNTQEIKKSVSTMLHKPTKPLDIASRTLLDVESVRVPPKEDLKLPAKMDTDKSQIEPSPSDDVSCNGDVALDNTSENSCPLSKRRRIVCSTLKQSQTLNSLQPAPLSSSTFSDTDNVIDYNGIVQDTPTNSNKNQIDSIDEPVRDSLNESVPKLLSKSVQKLKSVDETPISITTQDQVLPKRHDISEICSISSDLLCAQNLQSFESLTPDKILNLIDEEKHRPLSKMLIGNVIGLSLEECAMFNASKTTTTALDTEKIKTPTSPKVNHEKRDNAKENVACLDNRRYRRYSRSKRLSWKLTKQSDAGKLDKVLPNRDRQSCNDTDEKRNGNNARVNGRNTVSKENEYLSPFRVQTSLQAIARHTRSSKDMKTRVRTDKRVLMNQEFANSSIKKSRYKKRNREVANLSIDANFGPMPRGPRNRRLRCRNSTYANKKCYSTVIHSPSKRYMSTFKRKSKLTKVDGQRARNRQAKDRYRVSSTLHASRKTVGNSMKKPKRVKDTSNNNDDSHNCSYSGNNRNERKENNTKTDGKAATIEVDEPRDDSRTSSSFDRNLRKKLAQTAVPGRSQHATQTAHLHCCFRKKAQQQTKKPNTTDATTQCRLISDNPEIYVIGHLDDHRTILKMEWPKFNELKPECNVVRDNRRSRIPEQTRFCRASAFAESNLCCHRDGAGTMQDGGSAFVPVHMFDSDLRVARLRSIGFKPIIKPLIRNDSEIIQNALVSTSKVTKRDVAEEYDKYTSSEDNNVVVYLDDELQYQDIEEEDNESALTRECRTSLVRPSVSTRSTLKGVQSRDDGVLLPETLLSRENPESPWHGWKKIVTNNRSYWIGW